MFNLRNIFRFVLTCFLTKNCSAYEQLVKRSRKTARWVARADGMCRQIFLIAVVFRGAVRQR